VKWPAKAALDRRLQVGGAIGIEVQAADRAAWDAATSSFQRAFGRGVGKPAPVAGGGTKAPLLAPANDEVGAAPADPPPAARRVVP